MEKPVGNVRYIEEERSAAKLVGQLIDNVQTLVSQEIALGKAEIRAEYTSLKGQFFLFLLYSTTAGFASVLLTLSLIHLLSRAGLSDWAVYGMIGLMFGLVSAGLYNKSFQLTYHPKLSEGETHAR